MKKICIILLATLLFLSVGEAYSSEEIYTELDEKNELYQLMGQYEEAKSKRKFAELNGDEEYVQIYDKEVADLIERLKEQGVMFNEEVPEELQELMMENVNFPSVGGSVAMLSGIDYWDTAPSFDIFSEVCDITVVKSHTYYNEHKYYVYEVTLNNKEIQGLSSVYTDTVVLQGEINNVNAADNFAKASISWAANAILSAAIPNVYSLAISTLTSAIISYTAQNVVHGENVLTANNFAVDEYARYIYISDSEDENHVWKLATVANKAYVQYRLNLFYKASGSTTISIEEKKRSFVQVSKGYQDYEGAAWYFRNGYVSNGPRDFRLTKINLTFSLTGTTVKYSIPLVTPQLPGQLITIVTQ